ncbi:MAG: hypothetical protein D6820_00245 [Lentisphaerae bacterium]|nr:MAG: hypothetical protein D6820_00245 [Lentisphaerota bacterium]
MSTRFYVVASAIAGSAESYGWRRKGKIVWQGDYHPTPKESDSAIAQAKSWATKLGKAWEFEACTVYAIDPDMSLPRWVEKE